MEATKFYKPYPKPRLTAKQRVLRSVIVENRGYHTDCWIWQGEKDRNGYGRIKRGGHYVMAHWVLAGDPPVGMEVDHLCNTRACVRPEHLEFVTTRENARRREQRKREINEEGSSN